MGVKFNPYRMRYEFADYDAAETLNPYDNTYEFSSYGDVGYNVYTREYKLKKGKEMCEKYNPYTMRYEYVPCDWEVKFNPYTREYEFGPEE